MRSIQARKSKRNLRAQTTQCKRCLQTLFLKDLPWYACNRGVAGTLVRTPRNDLRPFTKRIAYSYAVQLTPTRLSAYRGGAIILTTALSVSVLPSGGVVRITTSSQLLSTLRGFITPHNFLLLFFENCQNYILQNIFLPFLFEYGQLLQNHQIAQDVFSFH